MKKGSIISGVVVLLIVVGFFVWKYSNYSISSVPIDTSETIGLSEESDSNKNPYTKGDLDEVLPFLDYLVENKDWDMVVKVTNDGIENYRDLVWEDIHFWSAHALALFEIGHCFDAGAAAYHIAIREPDNELAASIASQVSGDNPKCANDPSPYKGGLD